MALAPLIRGDYEVIDFVVMEPDPDNAGQTRPRDITNDTFLFTAKRTPKDTTPVFTKSTGDGIVKTSAADGEGYLEILPEDTENLTSETQLVCDLQGIAPINKPYTVLFNLKVKMDITT